MRLIQNLIGPGKARELLFTAENIDGKEAARIGLVNKAVPLDRLMDEALATAKKIAENSSFSIKMIKKGLLMAQGEISLVVFRLSIGIRMWFLSFRQWSAG